MNVILNTIAMRARSWSLLIISSFVAASLIITMLNVVSPEDIGPNGILVFFFLAYLFGVLITLLVLKALRLLFAMKFSAIKGMYLACAVAFAPIMLMALNTLDQLQVIDVVLVLAFEFLAIFYIWRRLQ